MKCKKCGAQIKENAKFCTVCGTPVKNAKSKNKKVIFGVVVTMIVLLIVGGLAFFYFNEQNANLKDDGKPKNTETETQQETVTQQMSETLEEAETQQELETETQIRSKTDVDEIQIETEENDTRTKEMQKITIAEFGKMCDVTQLEMLLPYVMEHDGRRISREEFAEVVFIYWRTCDWLNKEALIRPVDDRDIGNILYNRSDIAEIYKVFSDDELENAQYGWGLSIDSDYAHLREDADGDGIYLAHIYEAKTNGTQALIKYGVNMYSDYGYDYENQYEAELTLNTDNAFGVEVQRITKLKDTAVCVAKVTATSQLKNQGSHSYEPENLIDEDPQTAWVEGVGGYGEGESVTLYFDETDICGFQIYSGYGTSDERFAENAYAAEVNVSDGHGFSANYTVAGDVLQNAYWCIWFPETVHTNRLTFTITRAGTTSATIYEDTCISEIALYKAGN